MKNKFSEGSPIEVTVPSGGCTSGLPLKVGLLIGVPVTTQVIGDTVALHMTGVFDLASDTGTAWAVGDLAYWDDTAKVVTKTTTSNQKLGIITAAKLSAATTGRVRIQPVF